MYPKDLSEFYQHAVHLIYALVIAQTYVVVSAIFIPISNLHTWDGASSAYALALSYFVIVTGWIGYFKSIKRDPHTNKLGNARFAVDLIILFLFYYLVTLASPINKDNYSNTFLWLFPLMFGVFLLWDCFKYFEYIHEHASEKNNRKGRLKITIVFLVIFLIQAGAYYLVTTNYQGLTYHNHVAWNPIFISCSIIFTFLYRRRKWKTGNKRKNASKAKKANNS